MFSEAKKTTTPELLGRIIDIINTTYLDEVKLKNERENEEDEPEHEVKNEVDETSTCEIVEITQDEKENQKNSVSSKKHVYDSFFIII
jgi:hypothetical protein